MHPLALLPLLILFSSLANAADVVRYSGSGPLPIASAVEVNDLLFHSGVIPDPANPDSSPDSPTYWGNTEAQTENTLAKLQSSLEEKGYEMGDVVKLTIFLVAEPTTGRMDFGGMMNAYRRYFGEPSNGRLPARSVVEVAGLVREGMLVEIEAIAVKTED
jgi:enamine deaminase RidA (YjgF/YER057c/UK114 family)